MDNKLVEVFKWSPAGEQIKTINGTIQYRDWIHEKAKEFRKAGRQVQIMRRGKLIALFANDMKAG
jgi:hypothetical protein